MVNDTHVLVKRDACDQITTSTLALHSATSTY